MYKLSDSGLSHLGPLHRSASHFVEPPPEVTSLLTLVCVLCQISSVDAIKNWGVRGKAQRDWQHHLLQQQMGKKSTVPFSERGQYTHTRTDTGKAEVMKLTMGTAQERG